METTTAIGGGVLFLLLLAGGLLAWKFKREERLKIERDSYKSINKAYEKSQIDNAKRDINLFKLRKSNHSWLRKYLQGDKDSSAE